MDGTSDIIYSCCFILQRRDLRSRGVTWFLKVFKRKERGKKKTAWILCWSVSIEIFPFSQMAGEEKESLLDKITLMWTASLFFQYKEQFWKVESNVCAWLVINTSGEGTRNLSLDTSGNTCISAFYFISSVIFILNMSHEKFLFPPPRTCMLWSQSACVDSWLHLNQGYQ